MKKLFVTASLAASFSLAASAQSSSVSAPASSPQTTSSTSATEVKPAGKSKWSGSLLLVLEKDAINKDITLGSSSDNADIDGTSLMTQTHIGIGYKRDNGDSIKVVNRLFYDQSLWSERQSNAYFGLMRINYTTSGKALGGDAALTVRTAVPVNDIYRDLNVLMGVALLPSVTWELTPKWSVSYNGYAGTMLYAGKIDEGYPGYKRDLAKGSDYMDQATYNRVMNLSGAERSYINFDNSFAVNYNFTDTLSLSQSVGQGFGLKNYNHLKRVTQAWSLGTALAWQATANVGIEASVSQGIADMPGAQDLVLGKALYFDNYNFGLFRPEQTTYGLNISMSL